MVAGSLREGLAAQAARLERKTLVSPTAATASIGSTRMIADLIRAVLKGADELVTAPIDTVPRVVTQGIAVQRRA